MFFLVFFCIIVFVFFILFCCILSKREKEEKERIEKQILSLADSTLSMSPEEFISMRNTTFGGRGNPYYALSKNFPGVYILHNQTKGMYYVGQGKQVLNRVYSHFTGKGNGDVYADYKYGDKFSIRIISLEKSGFATLNDLERYAISTYNAYTHGYNKTRGNR